VLFFGMSYLTFSWDDCLLKAKGWISSSPPSLLSPVGTFSLWSNRFSWGRLAVFTGTMRVVEGTMVPYRPRSSSHRPALDEITMPL
jgi:hypothetical protein